MVNFKFNKKGIVKNKNSGITLISLVVTIIVLLILAGISISMLSGDNGLLKKAGDARDETIVGQEKEQVELAYISAAVKKLGDNVDKDDLQDELDASVGENKTKVTVDNNSLLNVNFKETKHNYIVNDNKISRIEDGTPVEELGTNEVIVGTKISNYRNDEEWQLLYYGELDNNNDSRIYLIMKNTLSNGIPQYSNYSGTSDFDGSNEFKEKFPSIEQGVLYKIYSQNILNYSSNNYNMKATEYLLDSSVERWNTYLDENDFTDYIIGAPTMELLVASYNTTIADDEKISIGDLTAYGYSNEIFSDVFENGTVWNYGTRYWIAAPVHMTLYGKIVGNVLTNGKVSGLSYKGNEAGFRPVVCLKSNAILIEDSENLGCYKIVLK